MIIAPKKFRKILGNHEKQREKIIPLPAWVLWRDLTWFILRSIWLDRVSWVSIRYGMNLHQDSNPQTVMPSGNEVNDTNWTIQNIKIETQNMNISLKKKKALTKKNKEKKNAQYLQIQMYGHYIFITLVRDNSKATQLDKCILICSKKEYSKT